MDNINCKEGYVKDLRKQHQAQQVGQRDEAYPFMMSERRRGRISSLGTTPTICETRPTNNTRPLSCSPPHHSSFTHHAAKRTRTMSLDEEAHGRRSAPPGSARSKRLGSVPLLNKYTRHKSSSNGGSSIDLSTSIVPEDFELPNEAVSPHLEANMINMPLNETTSALFRKRSSSLPRILPPILDHDGNEDDEALNSSFEDPNYNSEAGGRLAALKQMDQTSNLIVREMQKFVCRHASDVSQVLPLPLPANSRQQSRINSAGNKSAVQGKKSSKLDWKHTRVLMQSLAKLHAISQAIRDKSPGLFQEITSSLQPSGIKRQVDLDNKGVLVKILETHTPLFEEGCYEDIIKSVRSQASELYAIHTCPLFPVIVHGNVRNLVFKYNNKDEVVGVNLPSLRFASIGSPLLDIYGAVHSAKSGLHETSTALRGHLQTYHASFTEVANYLRLNLADFSLANLEAAFKKYELTGMIISSVRKTVASTDLGRSYSLGGRDMLIRGPIFGISGQEGHQLVQKGPNNAGVMHDLNSDLSKLVINIPFSHEEDDEDIFVEDPTETNQASTVK